MRSIIAALLVALVGSAAPKAADPVSADGTFRAGVDRFVESEMRLRPEFATQAGNHDYDGAVTDLSKSGLAHRVGDATTWHDWFSRIDPKALSPSNEADREFLLAHLDGVLLRERDLDNSSRNPGVYLPTAAVNGILKRSFAPLEERLALVTQRELAWLPNFEAARSNLIAADTPPISVDIALQQMPGTVGFFKTDVPAAFASVPDGSAQRAFRDANAKVLAAIADYEKWLREEFRPKAAGKFAIGAEAYARMLADDDMVDLPLPRLEQIGDAELARLLAAFETTARAIDPTKSSAEVFAGLSRTHPAATEVLASVSAGLSELRAFVVDHHLATVPSDVMPIVHETPPYARATSFASMDTPGPYEKAPEAYFNVTLPDPTWPPERREQLLQFFSPYNISDFSTHEVFPGHYTQFLNNRLNSDKVRTLFYSGANAEGWALYCEQMMLEEGLHHGDPKYGLAQIQAALQRACRYLVGIRMHTKGMTIEEAQAFFEKNAFMTPNNARVEAMRGTQDPGYLRYQLGKLMILKLRNDLRAKEGASFVLGRFHDAFLREGAVPIRLIRRELLGSDGPLL